MSGPGLYALSINVADILANEFKGDLLIAYSGGIDDKNIKEVLATGINPITLSSFLLKPKGYQNLGKLLVDTTIPKKIDTIKLKDLAAKAITDKNYDKKEVKVYQCKPNYSEFCAACHNCEDVCPNRANRRMKINGKDVVLHDPDLCNECGACAYNCIMGHKPYLEKACTIEPPSLLSNNFSFYFVGAFCGIIALFICTKKIENKKYILMISLVGSSIIPILPMLVNFNSFGLFALYYAIGFFNGFLFVYSVMWIEQFGKQRDKVELLSLIPFVMGLGIFIAYNFQAYIVCIQATILCLSCICVFYIDNKIFNSSIILFKSGTKYYHIETLEENEHKEYARESLFRIEKEKEEKKQSLLGKVYICGLISFIILILCGIWGLVNIKFESNFATLLGITPFALIINSLLIKSYNSYILPYSMIVCYISAAVFGNILYLHTPFIEYFFILSIVSLFTQILLLILSKLNLNNKICGLGLVGALACCSASCAYCLSELMGDKIMYLMCCGCIFAGISCYYKIKSIAEIEKKNKDNENDIELDDIDKE